MAKAGSKKQRRICRPRSRRAVLTPPVVGCDCCRRSVIRNQSVYFSQLIPGVGSGKVTVGLCERQVGVSLVSRGPVSCGKVTVGLCDRQVGAVLCPAVHGQQALLGPPGAAERRRLDGARSRPVRLRRDHDGPAAARACRRLAGRPPRLLSHSPGKLHAPVSPGTCILDLSPFGVRCRDPSVCLSVCLSVRLSVPADATATHCLLHQ